METVIKNNQKKTKRNLVLCIVFLVISIILLYWGFTGEATAMQWVTIFIPMICVLLFSVGIIANIYFMTCDEGVIVIGKDSIKVRLAEAEEMIEIPYMDIKGIRLLSVREAGATDSGKVIREDDKYLAIDLYDRDALISRVSTVAKGVIRDNLRRKVFPVMVLATDNLTLAPEDIFERLLVMISVPEDKIPPEVMENMKKQ